MEIWKTLALMIKIEMINTRIRVSKIISRERMLKVKQAVIVHLKKYLNWTYKILIKNRNHNSKM